jgi:Domain of unknown function (DUF5615)
MARIYSNENFYRPVVIKLRELGHDMLTSFEAGQANRRIPDEDVLLFAIAQKRILLTLNRKHFIRLHRLDPVHHGIIACTEDSDFEALAVRIHEALVKNEGKMDGTVIKIIRPNSGQK